MVNFNLLIFGLVANIENCTVLPNFIPCPTDFELKTMTDNFDGLQQYGLTEEFLAQIIAEGELERQREQMTEEEFEAEMQMQNQQLAEDYYLDNTEDD